MSDTCEWCSDRPVLKITAGNSYVRFACSQHKNKTRRLVHLDGYTPEDVRETWLEPKSATGEKG